MNDIVEAIVSLFEEDGGYKWDTIEQAHAQRKWELLSDENKSFLAGLSKEDLVNVCIGETRGEDDSDIQWLIKGAWTKLPPGVESFLSEIWEFKS